MEAIIPLHAFQPRDLPGTSVNLLTDPPIRVAIWFCVVIDISPAARSMMLVDCRIRVRTDGATFVTL